MVPSRAEPGDAAAAAGACVGGGVAPEELVRERARALGFDVVGVARADEPLDVEHERYLRFVGEGRHGQMSWLADEPEARRRLDGEAVLPGAKSVICVGRRYASGERSEPAPGGREQPGERSEPAPGGREQPGERSEPAPGGRERPRGDGERGDAGGLAAKIARYARGQDYHVFLRKKVRALAAFVRRLGQGVRARPLCDVEPVLERAWAARAGLGFVGKNGLVISPGLGSWLLLGEVVTTLELVPDVPIAERCGACTRCLDACPTSAFAEPFVLDPRRCVSYWTIEAAGPPPEELRPALGEHLFGCDVCQEVCPFNAGRAQAGIAPQFATHERWRGLGLRDVVVLGDEGFRRVAEGSPVHRAGRLGLARNAVLVAAGRVASGAGDDDARAAIEAGLEHGDGGVREVAVWAEGRTLRRLGAEAVQPGLERPGSGVAGVGSRDGGGSEGEG